MFSEWFLKVLKGCLRSSQAKRWASKQLPRASLDSLAESSIELVGDSKDIKCMFEGLVFRA